MHTQFCALFLLLAMPLIAYEEMMVIDSLFADYNGKKITLSGSVIVEHELGKICANKMVMTPTENDKKLRYATLKIKDNVILSLKDGGQLCCGIADLNYKALTGLLTGSTPEENVIYTDLCNEKGGNKTPVIIKSRQMGIVIAREMNADTNTCKSRIAEINTDQQVTVNYNQDFLVTADQCNYRRISEEDNKDFRGVPSEITFNQIGKEGNCMVCNKRGDIIHADKICINTVDRILSFEEPKGSIIPPEKHKGMDSIEFSAGRMVWNDKTDTLVLYDNVELRLQGLGTVVTDKEIQLVMGLEEGKKELQKVEVTGNTTITRFDKDKKESYILTTAGVVNLDLTHLQLVLDKPLVGEQIHYQDQMGEAFSDKLVFDYRKEGKLTIPTFLILEGNVRLINRTIAKKDGKNSPQLHYALADRIQFNPQTKETRFTMKKGKRVLFYDKINNIKMSAPAFKILRNNEFKSNSVHGIGDVRFSFLEQEIDQLKKRFSFDDEEL